MTVSQKQLAAIYVLDSIRGFGPVKFRQLYRARIEPEEVVRDPEQIPLKGATKEKIVVQIRSLTTSTIEDCENRARRYLDLAQRTDAEIITFGHDLYPRNVFESNDPTPVLYATGDLTALGQEKVVAVVGSRKTRPPYSDRIIDFCRVACAEGFAIVAGFALGADSIGHQTAIEQNGQTICVMPCGVDLVFPPENRELWRTLRNRSSGAVFVSEFGFGIRASAMRLRKRNKLIVAFARGVLIAQSAKKGGAMNAYRFGREQEKPIATFDPDHTEETSGNEFIRSDNVKGAAAVFPAVTSRPSEYLSWLNELLSST
jgi:DNA processing protein